MATTHTATTQDSVAPVITIRKVSAGAPFDWLKKGFADYKKSFLPSMLYGLIFAVVGMGVIFLASKNPIFSMAFISAFFLVGPFIAVGLYHLSWQIEEGEKPCLLDSIVHIKSNLLNLGLFIVILGFLMMIWMRIAALIAGVYFGNLELITEGVSALLTVEFNLEFAAFFTFFGFFIAQLAFSISVVAIPMIIHRKVDVITAIVTSLRVVMKNPIAMLVWAIIIVAMINLGFILFFLGLALTLPIIGHASWHAYRATVDD